MDWNNAAHRHLGYITKIQVSFYIESRGVHFAMKYFLQQKWNFFCCKNSKIVFTICIKIVSGIYDPDTPQVISDLDINV